jgi:hypothetical protein
MAEGKAQTAEVGARMAKGAPQPTVCTPPTAVCAPQSFICAPYAGVSAPQPIVCAPSNPDHPTWQQCGSHRGQSKSRFTLSKVNKTLTLIRRTRTLSDVTDGRDKRMDKQDRWTDAQTTLNEGCGGYNFSTQSNKSLPRYHRSVPLLRFGSASHNARHR